MRVSLKEATTEKEETTEEEKSRNNWRAEDRTTDGQKKKEGIADSN